MTKITFSFAAIIYQAYNPHREACKVWIDKPGRALISFERPTWGQLFQDIASAHPGVEFEIPDEIDVITYNNKFQIIKE